MKVSAFPPTALRHMPEENSNTLVETVREKQSLTTVRECKKNAKMSAVRKSVIPHSAICRIIDHTHTQRDSAQLYVW